MKKMKKEKEREEQKKETEQTGKKKEKKRKDGGEEGEEKKEQVETKRIGKKRMAAETTERIRRCSEDEMEVETAAKRKASQAGDACPLLSLREWQMATHTERRQKRESEQE
ncbi:UNVERIFIED_CONTAM: hypothetical protein HHA_452090 [Hammondia hammondi]|eukprot:XP_008885137.1 hypothetical protein HHA_452090 [Hammondia hammondi]